MNESCHMYERVRSHILMSHVTRMNESCHTYEWVMSHVWKSQVSHINESCHTYQWVRSDASHTHVKTYEWVRSHVKMSHGTRINDSHIKELRTGITHTHTYTHTHTHARTHTHTHTVFFCLTHKHPPTYTFSNPSSETADSTWNMLWCEVRRIAHVYQICCIRNYKFNVEHVLVRSVLHHMCAKCVASETTNSMWNMF